MIWLYRKWSCGGCPEPIPATTSPIKLGMLDFDVRLYGWCFDSKDDTPIHLPTTPPHQRILFIYWFLVLLNGFWLWLQMVPPDACMSRDQPSFHHPSHQHPHHQHHHISIHISIIASPITSASIIILVRSHCCACWLRRTGCRHGVDGR